MVPLAALALAIAADCTRRQADPDAGKVPLEVKVAEAKDSTRLESAAIDSARPDSAGDRTQSADSTKKRPLRFR